MMDERYNRILTPLEVREIWNITYNVFYKKWISPETIHDSEVMWQEVREIDRKYNCKMCHEMLMGLVESIDQEIVRRNQNVSTNNQD
jgi:hypothetical protein